MTSRRAWLLQECCSINSQHSFVSTMALILLFQCSYILWCDLEKNEKPRFQSVHLPEPLCDCRVPRNCSDFISSANSVSWEHVLTYCVNSFTLFHLMLHDLMRQVTSLCVISLYTRSSFIPVCLQLVFPQESWLFPSNHKTKKYCFFLSSELQVGPSE